MSTQNGSRAASSGRRRPNGGKPSPAALARQAAGELAELLGRDPEGIVSLERGEDGWFVGVEVVEVRRIPDTADVLAEYEVEADEDGHLTGYRRMRRYPRGKAQDAR
jgi:Gas vesicle synthesis protein GvpO